MSVVSQIETSILEPDGPLGLRPSFSFQGLHLSPFMSRFKKKKKKSVFHDYCIDSASRKLKTKRERVFLCGVTPKRKQPLLTSCSE